VKRGRQFFDEAAQAFVTADPNADYGELWAAVHDYLVCQAAEPPNAADLAVSFMRLVEAHNMIHRRYIADQEKPLELAGT